MNIDLSRNTQAKDFSYQSGERQTGLHLQDIRADHGSRYQLAAAILKKGVGKPVRPLSGIDAFCGNGYGARLISEALGAHVIGLDGSEESIRVANLHYGTARTLFSHKLFPFELPRSTYDFAICFESIEHVEDPQALFDVLCNSLRTGGVLFLSTPNEETMPHSVNAQWFKHHTRHFRPEEVQALAEKRGDMVLGLRFGQKVYHIDESKRVVAIDTAMDMRPSSQIADAHFFVHVYVRCDNARTAAESVR